jgi:2-keto-4-pentenoate hydratase
MTEAQIDAAADTLLQHWRSSRRLAALPGHLRPGTSADGYAIQASIARRTGQAIAGWKIAATSAAGQRHIGVDGPLAGPLFADRILDGGSTLSLDGNHMRVAEAEFAFRFGRELLPRPMPFTDLEVLAAAASLHLAIEVPDSRYEDFTAVGAPQLIADCACAHWFLLGPAVTTDWRTRDLAAHEVVGYRNDVGVERGRGSNVLGDPRIALTWLANELRGIGTPLRTGQVVTTGTCLVPLAVAPGDHVSIDFGDFGTIDARFS